MSKNLSSILKEYELSDSEMSQPNTSWTRGSNLEDSFSSDSNHSSNLENQWFLKPEIEINLFCKTQRNNSRSIPIEMTKR